MKSKFRIVVIVIVILLLVVVALPFLIDLNAFRPKLEAQLTNALGRQVKIGNLKMSILSGSVTADNLSIADDPAFSSSPFVQAKSLQVGVELIPLVFSRAVHVTGFTLQQPQITLLQSKSGTWNFSNLGNNSQAQGSKPGTPPMGNLSVHKLNISGGRILVGQAPGKPRVYDDVNIEVTDFSPTSAFPFTMSAKLPAGGELKLSGKAGPINSADTALSPVTAHLNVSHLDLAAAGFVSPASGISGLTDFDGQITSDGKTLQATGTMKADKLQLSSKGKPAGRPVEVKYDLSHNLQSNSGVLKDATVTLGKAVAHVSGTYRTGGEARLLDMKVAGQNMPVDDLVAVLPAFGVVLPSGSSLKGGALSTNLSSTGPIDKLITTGSLKLANTSLAGFDLGSKMSSIASLLGGKTGSVTSIQSLTSNFRVTPEGIQTDAIDLVVPAIGQLTGNGSVSPSEALNYKMIAKLGSSPGGSAGGLGQLLGNAGAISGGIPFLIQGTASNPTFVPDVKGMAAGKIKSMVPSGKGNVSDVLGGFFGKKKK